MVVPLQAAVSVLDSHVQFPQAPQPKRPEVHVPDPINDFLKADVLADAGG